MNVRNEIDTHFALGCLDGRVGLTGRNRVTLTKELSSGTYRLTFIFRYDDDELTLK